MAVRSWAQAKF